MGNMGDSESRESQQDIDGPSDCIQAVPDDGEADTEFVLPDPEPEGKVMQSVYNVYKLCMRESNYWVNTI